MKKTKRNMEIFSLNSQSSKFAQQLHLKEIPNLLGGHGNY